MAHVVAETFAGHFDLERHPRDPQGLVGSIVACIRTASKTRAAGAFVPNANGGSTPGQAVGATVVGGGVAGGTSPSPPTRVEPGRDVPIASSAGADCCPADGTSLIDVWSDMQGHDVMSQRGKHRVTHPLAWLCLPFLGKGFKAENNLLGRYEPAHLAELAKNGRDKAKAKDVNEHW